MRLHRWCPLRLPCTHLPLVKVSSTLTRSVPLIILKKNSIAAQPHHEGHLITWYGVDEESDEDLLDAFFCQNPGLAEQVTRMKTHRRKRQTDASLVRDYKFSLEVYKLLMERQWEVGLKFILNSLLFSICWAERKRPHLERVNHEIYWAQCALVHKGPKGYRTT